jgi:hypothetical protein
MIKIKEIREPSVFYYYLSGTSPWLVFPADLNSMITLNVGINKISGEKWETVAGLPEIMQALSENEIMLLSDEKQSGMPLYQVVSARSNPEMVMKIVRGCFDSETLNNWKTDLSDSKNRNLLSIIDHQLESLHK